MTDLVNYQLDGKIATITMQNGKVNAMSPDHIAAINGALDQAEQEKAAVVVLAGKPGIFSAGFDLKVFQADAREGVEMVRAGSRLCRRLLAFPMPVLAVCTGHSLAQGCFTLMACDFRIGVEGPFQLGLNEIQIGMTMHHFGIELPRARLTPACFQRAITTAQMFSPQEAVEGGFLDKIVPADALPATVQAEANRLAGLNLVAHHVTKLKMRASLLKTLDDAIELDYQEQLALLA
ncbi:Short-chain-enoyl-CoA hydratase [Zhongshania aliphaticivorans]|uniref:Short-chain-enoyl-CoA hydratase n=2 Tax=Zhongshania aliphaticivorans TaxID=1470434 RepID=A0A5S9NPX3_9GAMM|nr:Short-chain-enoyl-CoA hydratase [Zhongshania aliphaticivorans]CAA0109726.1 Short-chain-enoyl-CoA hydratase [Zhongshania aliphaticivorans]